MRLPHAGDLPFPAYQSEFAAGLDLVEVTDVRHAVDEALILAG